MKKSKATPTKSSSKGTLRPTQRRGFVLVVSAPSGTGKTVLCDRLRDEVSECTRSVSITTRARRATEQTKRDYLFVSAEDFQRRIKKKEFLEFAKVYGNFYGTPKKPVMNALELGQVIVMDIDPIGARNVKRALGKDAVLVFIVPPSFKELARRLKRRGTNSKDDVSRRLKAAKKEIKQAVHYDYLIVNDDLEDAFSNLVSLVQIERQKISRLRLPK